MSVDSQPADPIAKLPAAGLLQANLDAGIEPLDLFEAGIRAGRFQEDPAQRRLLTELDRLHIALVAATPEGFFERVLARFSKPKQLQGIYLWGDVGRGKTLLMDLFFQSLPFPQKQRLHFHHFMQRVHRELAELKHTADPLEQVCERFASECRVLCFDEFFVSDIADAMLLQTLLQGLFERNVVLVATSNVPPASLYKDGLQRARFLPAIGLLEQFCKVLKLDASQDYRLRTLAQAKIYLLNPPNVVGEANQTPQLQKLFTELATAERTEQIDFDVNGHKLRALQLSGDLAWFEFSELCEKPRAAMDYIELAQEFHTIMLSNVPVLTTGSEDAARRFMFLVDEFYDRKVNLIVSAAAPPTELYQGHKFTFEFQRTASRLIEMQSETYLASPHLG